MPLSYLICTFLGFTFFLIAILAQINSAQIKVYLIASSVVLYGLPILKDAALGLTRFKVNGNLLFSIAILGLILLNKLFEAAIYMGIVSFGKIFQDLIFDKFYTKIEKQFQRPTTCQKFVDDKLINCPIEQLSAGDIISLQPNHICPVDAIITKGQGELAKSIVGKNIINNILNPDDVLYAGSIVKNNALILKATSNADKSFLLNAYKSIAQSVQQIQIIEDNNYSNSYSKRILTFIIFMALPFFFFKVQMILWIEYSIILLLVFSPYNSIIKTSILLFANIIKKSCENGIITNKPTAIQIANSVKVVAIEKNTVLTKDKLILSNIYAPYPFSRTQLLQIISNLTTAANHPLAKTISKNALEFESVTINTENVVVGENEQYNVQGQVTGHNVVLGTNVFLEKHGIKTSILLKKYSEYLTNGCTVLFVAVDGQPAGLISFIDDIMPKTFSIIRQFRSYGIKNVILLSQSINKSDKKSKPVSFSHNSSTASKIANIKRLHHRYGNIMLVGDIKTDLPSLNQADISVAVEVLNSDNNVVDISIITNNFDKLPELFRLNNIYKKTLNVYKKLYFLLKLILLILVILNYIYLWQALLLDCLISLILLLNCRFSIKF